VNLDIAAAKKTLRLVLRHRRTILRINIRP
jgi:hypothetical protein